MLGKKKFIVYYKIIQKKIRLHDRPTFFNKKFFFTQPNFLEILKFSGEILT